MNGRIIVNHQDSSVSAHNDSITGYAATAIRPPDSGNKPDFHPENPVFHQRDSIARSLLEKRPIPA
jgi:hypothetical protein